MGLDVATHSIPNPRQEREQHYYNPAHTGLLKLGLEPHLMTRDVLIRMLERVRQYADRIVPARILPRVRWNRETAKA
jgi:UDP-sulfoquinovose synthase